MDRARVQRRRDWQIAMAGSGTGPEVHASFSSSFPFWSTSHPVSRLEAKRCIAMQQPMQKVVRTREKKIQNKTLH